MAILLACGGGGSWGDAPTEPHLPTGGRLLLISFTLQNSTNANTIQEARLLFDAQELQRFEGTATNVVKLSGIVASTSAGNHTVGVQIRQQTQSPSSYVTGASGGPPNLIVVQDNQGLVSTLSLPRETVSMQTGDTKLFTVTIP